MTEITDLIARNLIDISNERNQVERLVAVQELWAQHGVMMVDDGTYVGHSAIEIAAGALLSCYPECDFTLLGITDEVVAADR
jgi:predicted phosphoribosyltransferase